MAQSVLPLTSSDLSLFTLFWHAHWIVKGVMVGLLVCSVWVWAIAIDKTVLYTRTRKAWTASKPRSGPASRWKSSTARCRPSRTTRWRRLFVAAMREWKRSFEGPQRSFAGLQMRIEKVMQVTIAREVERLERRLLVLATVGSAGPFVGLFGTVWGIMTSFQSIAASKNTSLAVVAPGIAEALFATAIGLVAAIPATIFYNKFAGEVNKQAQRLEGFADEFSAILSRKSTNANRHVRDRNGGERLRRCAGTFSRKPVMAANAGTPIIGQQTASPPPQVMTEINVTPMVDVMLVLLIIFMVSAPLLTVGVPIDLPQSQAKSLDQDKEPLTLSVNRQGQGLSPERGDRARRSGRQIGGDRAGARRQRRAHLRARRQERELRDDDAGDGPALGGRLPSRRAGHRIRAGLEG